MVASKARLAATQRVPHTAVALVGVMAVLQGACEGSAARDEARGGAAAMGASGTPSGGAPAASGGMPSGAGAGGASTGGGSSGAAATATGGAGSGGASAAGSSSGNGATAGNRPAAEGGASTAGAGSANGGAPGGGAGVAAAGTSGSGAGGAPPFDGKELFILFGQSNMSGLSPMPKDPWPIDENVTFMVQFDCSRLGQTKDEWLPAQPPLHGCQWATNGLGLGLADFFGVSLAEAWPEARIGLIPNAIPGVTIDVFMKGGATYQGLPDGYTSAYTLMVDRVKEAQKVGRVRAILFHQGESDWNKGFADTWLGKVATVVADLRADLGLTEAVPFIAGEIPPEGNYDGINVEVAKIPDTIPNSAVVSAQGTHVHDVAHFDAESARLMGERYAETFLTLVNR